MVGLETGLLGILQSLPPVPHRSAWNTVVLELLLQHFSECWLSEFRSSHFPGKHSASSGSLCSKHIFQAGNKCLQQKLNNCRFAEIKNKILVRISKSLSFAVKHPSFSLASLVWQAWLFNYDWNTKCLCDCIFFCFWQHPLSKARRARVYSSVLVGEWKIHAIETDIQHFKLNKPVLRRNDVTNII